MVINLQKDRRVVHRMALERPLATLAIELTAHCNLACKMCSEWKRREHGVPHSRVLSLLDEAHVLGATRFAPCGTEIFSREDTVDILSYAERIGFKETSIVSNGSLLSDGDRIKKLEKLSTLLMTISLDGPREVHDNLRGKGVYDKAVEALRELCSRGITSSISSVIMRQTIDRLKDIVDLAADLNIPVISFQPYTRETAGLDNDHAAFEFRPEEERSVRMKLKDLLRYAVSKNIMVYTANMMDLIPPYLTRGVRPVPPGGCFVPSGMLLVGTSGETHPCFMMQKVMKEKSMGNVFEKSLTEIWHNDFHRELNMLALNRKCPGCLAGCSDVESYNAQSQRRLLPEWMEYIITQVGRVLRY
jgi:MoaA/NifB/PqqE/SkfB family radical SAM enzyme